MADFHHQMEAFKQQWRSRFQQAHKVQVEWEWRTYKGIYEGEAKKKDGRMVPDGCGRWTGQYRKWTLKIEAEWKDGWVMGKAVNYYSDGEEVQWQTEDGWLCQKVIHWLEDGGHREGEDPKSIFD